MTKYSRRAFFTALAGAALAVALAAPGTARAVEVGERAPEFTLPASTGTDVGLRDFHGRKWVLIEFYGADFAPT